jgi:amidohydrolase
MIQHRSHPIVERFRAALRQIILVLAAIFPIAGAWGVEGSKSVAVRERADLREPIVRSVDKNLAEWVALYKEIHAKPELSLEEKESAARLARLFRQYGYKVTTDVGGHGVVAVLENGRGPTVLVRGDMDALPVTEETGLPYASKVRVQRPDGSWTGVMHACGHDAHQAILAGTAQTLAALKDRWSGTLVLIAQPAEELGLGAGMMIRDGLFERFPRPDVCIALHVSHELPHGSVGYTPGWATANVDSVDIRIHGKGGHGARPNQAVDPIITAAHVITALQTIASRRVDPIETVVVTVGSIQAGTKHNIIPAHADLQLTVRTYTDEIRQQVLDSIRQITTDVCRAMGCPKPPDVTVRDDEFTPAAFNDETLAHEAAELFRQVLGSDKVVRRPPTMGGEDFGRYADTLGAPGLMFWLGSVDPKLIEASRQPGGPPLPSAHSSAYAPVPEPTIRTGVRAMTSLALGLLGDARDGDPGIGR